MGNVHHISTAIMKEPHFPGVIGYVPLPLPMSREEIQMLPYDMLVAEIRHYLTIVDQKKEWRRKRDETIRRMKGEKRARLQSGQPKK